MNQGLLMDGHCDTVHHWLKTGKGLKEPNPAAQLDLPRLQRAGIHAQVFALWVEPEYIPERGLYRLMQLLEAALASFDEARQQVELIRSGADLEAALAKGRIAALLAVEGAAPLGDDLRILRLLHRLHVRIIGLVWNHRNQFADGALVGADGAGLTSLGEELVDEAYRLGMLLDLSHLNRKGFDDVLKRWRGPAWVSHTAARALCDHPRNLDDEQLQAVAETGGVIGVNFYPPFLDPSGDADISSVVRHITYIGQKIGFEHVALGSDFDGIDKVATGLEDVQRFPRLISALRAEGATDAQIGQIMGGNLLRLWSSL